MSDKKSGTTEAVHVLVVDDHAIIRKGIRAVLDLVPDIDLVGEAENGLQAVELENRGNQGDQKAATRSPHPCVDQFCW